ncbi:sensor histidine kinase [Arthrobacter sp. HY1533]|uniref:sensor histidine kinase n=1 Tax=Arthrobacter sp. HY1533 TaxID=2970919 RepID=UPI0022BA020F|nr:HAMP domain-containing sensor histidine kinase [Arthrobacter sp. HY1533]
MTNPAQDTLLKRHFYKRTLRMRVLLTQLPLTLTVLLTVGLAAAYYPVILAGPHFIAGLWMQAAILALCVAVPWDRMPRGAFLAIPYLDLVSVGFIRDGSAQYITSVGLLALFPVFWLSASGYARKTAIVSSTLGTLLIVWVPLFLGPAKITPELLAKPLVFPFMMMAFSMTVVIMTASMDSQRKALQAKDAELRTALELSKQREQMLATVLDTVAVGIVVVDEGGNDQLMNATQDTIRAQALPPGMADPQEKDLLLFGHGKVPLPPDERPVRRAILGESFTNYQMWIGQGENSRAISTTARTMRNEDGSSAGAVIAFHDNTEVMAALAAKDDFVANVSHEFRTPLTSILGYLGMVLDDADRLPADINKFLTITQRNALRLNRLVSDLLTTDSMEVTPAMTDIATLAHESVVSARPMAERNGVELTEHVPDQLWAMVDAGRIGQALDNLISNAIKYSPDGGTVTVSAVADGADVVLEVRDTGMGMSSAEQAQAFTKFFRADPALERSIPGLGLGLLITKAIVANHGGAITVQSERNVGTTMRIELPESVLVLN